MPGLPERSPLIGANGWGTVTVEGVGEFRDVKLWPGGARGWDWGETGTHHRPGVQPADVLELLEHGADVVVLSRGRQLRLHESPETLALLEGQGVDVVSEETGAAIDRDNALASSGRRVGGLFHTTC